MEYINKNNWPIRKNVDPFWSSKLINKNKVFWFLQGTNLGEGRKGMIAFIKRIKKEKNISLDEALKYTKKDKKSREEFSRVWNTINIK
jgi:hypothetical protein